MVSLEIIEIIQFFAAHDDYVRDIDLPKNYEYDSMEYLCREGYLRRQGWLYKPEGKAPYERSKYTTTLKGRAALSAFEDAREQEAKQKADQSKKDAQAIVNRRQDRRDKYVLSLFTAVVGYIIGRFGNQIEQFIRGMFALVKSLFS